MNNRKWVILGLLTLLAVAFWTGVILQIQASDWPWRDGATEGMSTLAAAFYMLWKIPNGFVAPRELPVWAGVLYTSFFLLLTAVLIVAWFRALLGSGLVLARSAAYLLLYLALVPASTIFWGTPPWWGMLLLLPVTWPLTTLFSRWVGWYEDGTFDQKPLLAPLMKLALAMLVISGLFGQYWRLRIRMVEKDMKAAGIPVSLTELARDIPADKNAAPVMDKWYADFTRTRAGENLSDLKLVSEMLKEVDGEGVIFKGGVEMDKGQAWGANAPARLDRLYAKFPRFFRMVRVDLALILAKYDLREWTDFRRLATETKLELPPYSGHVNTCRFQRVIAERKAMDGDLAGAWAQVRLQLKFCELLVQDSFLISALICVANEGVAARTAMAILQNNRNAVMPGYVAKAMEDISRNRWIQAGLTGDNARSLDLGRNIRGFFNWKIPAPWVEYLSMGRMGYAVTRYCMFNGLADAAFLPILRDVYFRILINRAWDPSYLENDADKWNASHGWIYAILPMMGYPRYGQLVLKGYEGRTRVQLLVVVSAIHEYRNRTGKYPDRLAGLGKAVSPDMLVDLFNGKELGYKVSPAGFELFSVGPWGTRMDSRETALVYREPFPSGKKAK